MKVINQVPLLHFDEFENLPSLLLLERLNLLSCLLFNHLVDNILGLLFCYVLELCLLFFYPFIPCFQEVDKLAFNLPIEASHFICEYG